MPTEPWYQAALFDAQVLELNVRLGVIPSVGHVQALAELKDPTTDRLIAQWSAPHATMDDLHSVWFETCQQARLMLQDELEAF